MRDMLSEQTKTFLVMLLNPFFEFLGNATKPCSPTVTLYFTNGFVNIFVTNMSEALVVKNEDKKHLKAI
jgi:hypothetical protein